VKYILAIVIAMVIVGCSLKMYGNLRCEGPCELTLEREAGELNPIPEPITKGK
jgi:hypothetical protein